MSTSAIYRIEIAHKFYYGQTGNLARREAEHRAKLEAGSHENRYMQAAFDKYEGAFQLEAVQTHLPLEELDAAEQAYLDAHLDDPDCMNIAPVAGGGTRGIVWAESSATQMSAAKRRPVYVTDLVSRETVTFPGADIAARLLQVHTETLRAWIDSASQPCYSPQSSASFDFRHMYFGDPSDAPQLSDLPLLPLHEVRPRDKRRAVFVENLETGEVLEFKTVIAAARQYGVSRWKVQRWIDGSCDLAHLRFFTEDGPTRKGRTGVRVEDTVTGDTRDFANAAECAEALGLSVNKLSMWLTGRSLQPNDLGDNARESHLTRFRFTKC